MPIPLADQIWVHHDPGKKDEKTPQKGLDLSEGALAAAQAAAQQFVVQANAKAPWSLRDLRLASPAPLPIALSKYPRSLPHWVTLAQQLKHSEQLALAQAILANTVQWASTKEGHDYWADHNAVLKRLAADLAQMGV